MSVVAASWWNSTGQLLHSPYRHKGFKIHFIRSGSVLAQSFLEQIIGYGSNTMSVFVLLRYHKASENRRGYDFSAPTVLSTRSLSRNVSKQIIDCDFTVLSCCFPVLMKAAERTAQMITRDWRERSLALCFSSENKDFVTFFRFDLFVFTLHISKGMHAFNLKLRGFMTVSLTCHSLTFVILATRSPRGHHLSLVVTCTSCFSVYSACTLFTRLHVFVP